MQMQSRLAHFWVMIKVIIIIIIIIIIISECGDMMILVPTNLSRHTLYL